MTDDNDSDDYFHNSSDGSSDKDGSDDNDDSDYSDDSNDNDDSDCSDKRSTLSSDDGNSSPLSSSSEHLVSHYTMLVVGVDMWRLWTPGRGPFCV